MPWAATIMDITTTIVVITGVTGAVIMVTITATGPGDTGITTTVTAIPGTMATGTAFKLKPL